MCESKTNTEIVATCSSTCTNFARCAARLEALDSVPLPKALLHRDRQGPSAIRLAAHLEHRPGAINARARTYPMLVAENA
jgi:hypothetical protein